MTETRGRVALVTLHRPKALNALCNGLFVELNQVLKEFDNNKDIGSIVITGSERAFAGKLVPRVLLNDVYTLVPLLTKGICYIHFINIFCVLAGADIKEMKDRQFIENYVEDFLGHWTQITKIRKPIIAAVNGFAVRCLSLSCLASVGVHVDDGLNFTRDTHVQ